MKTSGLISPRCARQIFWSVYVAKSPDYGVHDMFFGCNMWIHCRRILEHSVGNITPAGIVGLMLQDDDTGKKISHLRVDCAQEEVGRDKEMRQKQLKEQLITASVKIVKLQLGTARKCRYYFLGVCSQRAPKYSYLPNGALFLLIFLKFQFLFHKQIVSNFSFCLD